MSKMRLQVALSKGGVASRRKAAEIIESGAVRVNGKIVREKGFRIDISRDTISFNKKIVSFSKERHYYILNKPAGVLSTAKDERGRKTVLDFVKGKPFRLYPVGRLDKDTTGLILLTDDGEVAYRLMHPKFEIDRVYTAKVEGRVEPEKIERLKKGIILDGKPAHAEKVFFLKKAENFTVLSVTLREGRKREIRRLFESIGYDVVELKRVAYGPLELKGLREGQTRQLTTTELTKLKEVNKRNPSLTAPVRKG